MDLPLACVPSRCILVTLCIVGLCSIFLLFREVWERIRADTPRHASYLSSPFLNFSLEPLSLQQQIINRNLVLHTHRIHTERNAVGLVVVRVCIRRVETERRRRRFLIIFESRLIDKRWINGWKEAGWDMDICKIIYIRVNGNLEIGLSLINTGYETGARKCRDNFSPV